MKKLSLFGYLTEIENLVKQIKDVSAYPFILDCKESILYIDKEEEEDEEEGGDK